MLARLQRGGAGGVAGLGLPWGAALPDRPGRGLPPPSPPPLSSPLPPPPAAARPGRLRSPWEMWSPRTWTRVAASTSRVSPGRAPHVSHPGSPHPSSQSMRGTHTPRVPEGPPAALPLSPALSTFSFFFSFFLSTTLQFHCVFACPLGWAQPGAGGAVREAAEVPVCLPNERLGCAGGVCVGSGDRGACSCAELPRAAGREGGSCAPERCRQAGSCAGKPLSTWGLLGLGRQMNFLPLSNAGGEFWGRGKDWLHPWGTPGCPCPPTARAGHSSSPATV